MKHDILDLIIHNLAATNQQVLEWLSLKYDTDRHTVKTLLYRLVQERKIQRVKRGYYTRAQ